MGCKKEKPATIDSLAPAEQTVEELIKQGCHAIAEYDYEVAGAALTRAFELSGGAEAAARALLELLVDNLAAYHDALAIGERVSRGALASPPVQRLLGLAAARSGVPQRARVHLAHLDGAAAAEILVVLAEAAMTAGDLDEAQHLCDEAGSHDRSHVDLQPLVRRLAHAREAARRPLEAAIDRALAENNLENAKRLAGQLLARFPESAVARRAVRAVREQGAAAA